MSGSRVDIYVGPQKKHYTLPKKLLCYYSEYFERCFNGNFIEGQTQKLTLDEDKVEDFEILLEYMISGGIISKDAVSVKETGQLGLKRCMEFIQYTDKYGMGDASSAVYDTLQKVLPTTLINMDGIYGGAQGAGIQPSHVETVFRVTTSGSPLRMMILQAAL